MKESILEGIDRKQASSYIFKVSLIGFLIVILGVIAYVIKITVFPASSSTGYLIFIIRYLLLSSILFASSLYTKNSDTIFAVSFDKANGTVKLFWIIGFAISATIIHELLSIILSKII